MHFGLGTERPRELIVRYPDGTTKRYGNVPTSELFVAKK